MTEQPTALRLADEVQRPYIKASAWEKEAAAELRRLHADAEEAEVRREWISSLLTSTAIALRGPEPELTNWSWHDLPERAAALVAQRDALLEALKKVAAIEDKMFGSDWEEIEEAREIARAAIKAVEEGK